MHAASGLCTHGVSNVGVVTAGPARLNSSNVGVSLRARWDTGQVRHISSRYNEAATIPVKPGNPASTVTICPLHPAVLTHNLLL